MVNNEIVTSFIIKTKVAIVSIHARGSLLTAVLTNVVDLRKLANLGPFIQTQIRGIHLQRSIGRQGWEWTGARGCCRRLCICSRRARWGLALTIERRRLVGGKRVDWARDMGSALAICLGRRSSKFPDSCRGSKTAGGSLLQL